MDPVLKLFGQTQFELSKIVFRRKKISMSILQPAEIRDSASLIEHLHDLLEIANLRNEYSTALKALWGNRPGVGMVGASLEERCRAALNCIASMNPRKHVIFLGAGASASAGYPLGNGLAALMKNPELLEKEFIGCLVNSGISVEDASRTCESVLKPFLTRFKEPLQLFSGSGYATIDHFSKEARNGKFREAVQKLKKLIRLILALPSGRNFDGSDYDEFINKLFDPNGAGLRDDVTVITFNYDFCLQYHLYKRFSYRNQIRTMLSQGEMFSLHDRLNSGLASWPERSWSTKAQLSILQLHGSIAYPRQQIVGDRIVRGGLFQEEFFANDSTAALKQLCDPEFEAPPLAFPFEIFNEAGEMVPASDFPLEQPTEHGSENLHPLFSFLWEHARQEVELADRISFVGLSLHSFLEPGLKFLFQRKIGPTQLIIANPENKKFGKEHSNSLIQRTATFLQNATRGQIEFLRSSADQGEIEGFDARKGVTAYTSFRDMITHEL